MMGGPARRASGSVVLAAGVVLAAAAAASAHVVLQQSLPPPNASLGSPPREVILTFSEPATPGISTAAVLDSGGAVVSRGSEVSADGRRLVVKVDALTPGVYTVRWRALSAADGHTTSSFFAFAVGVPAPAETAGQAVKPSWPLVVARWLGLLGALAAAGAAFFEYLVVRPVREGPSSGGPAHSHVWGVLRRLTSASAVILLVGVGAEFLLQSKALFDVPLREAAGSGILWQLLTTTKMGYSTLVRLSMAVIFLLPTTRRGRVFRMTALIWMVVVGVLVAVLRDPTAVSGSHIVHLGFLLLVATVYGLISILAALVLPLVPDLRLPEGLWVLPVAGAVVLGGITLSSHAAGIGPLAVLADWVHLMAAALWVGGLLTLVLVLATADRLLRADLASAFAPRFSNLAALSVGLLTVTGGYAAWLHIPALRAFVATLYGEALLAKLLLFLPLVGLGAANRFLLRPRVERGGAPGAVRWFVRTTGGEAALAAGILLAVAVLTVTPPATLTMPAPGRPPMILAGFAGPFRVELTISPAEPGWNTMEAVVQRSDRPVDAASTRILVRLVKLDDELDPVTIALQSQGDRFAAEGGALALPGWWEVRVIVRERGAQDVSTAFPLRLGAAPTAQSGPEALRLLARALDAARGVRSWREVEQITDGAGGVTVTTLEMVRPDRLRFRTAGGSEAVIIGAERYAREGTGPWARDTLPDPIALEGPYTAFLAEPSSAALGRRATCEGEPCRVVTWNQSETVAFAGWIGERTARVYRLMMAAPIHFMTSQVVDLNAPVTITPP